MKATTTTISVSATTALTAALIPHLAAAAATCSYTQSATITSGARSAAIIAVDLNKDKILDIVTTAQGDGTISVALGQKGGKFAAPTTYKTSTVGPYETVAADFNGDGYPDLASANFGASNGAPFGVAVSIHINKGDGTFKDYVDVSATDREDDKLRAITAGDFNKDGKMDLAVAAQKTGLQILLGKGDGTFAPHVLYPAGAAVHGIVAADFNKDGKLDVALANNSPKNGAVNVLFGKGDGTFEATTAFAAGASTFGLDTADLNGDGYPDIVTANQADSTTSVLLNLGSKQPGSFAPQVVYAASGKAVAITAGDLNGDGKPELLTAANSGGVTDVYFNKGDGTFEASLPVATGNGAYDSVVADFNGDGTADFATVLGNGSAVVMQGSCKK
ncbi:MAG: VCBS repeat-containing protein [Steroidobacteraceae bacterium]